MKKIYYKIVPLFLLLFGLTGCEKYLGEDTNVDPTRPVDVSVSTLLPTIEYYTGDSYYRNAFISAQYTQQIGSVVAAGTDSQLRNEFAAQWSNFYLNILSNCNIMIKKAAETNSPHYAGVAKIILAANLGLVATTWENAPLTQADNNLTNFAPEYDSQEAIYTATLKYLDEGIADLAQSSSYYKVGAEDIIYNGDLKKWTKAANALKARYLLHLAKKQGAVTITNALTAVQNGISSNAEDFQLTYNTRIFNPWHSNVALANNTGNLTVTFGDQFINTMNGTREPKVVDPRLPFIAYKTGTSAVYRGVEAGKGSGASSPSNTVFNNKTPEFFGWFCRQTSPIEIITFAETKFIEAELRFLQNGGTTSSVGSTAASFTAFQAGIKANCEKIGVSAANITNYQTAYALDETKLKLSHIMTEKYKALFLHPEIWNDLRRYNYDATIYEGLALPANHNPDLKGSWIQRAAYPGSETARNSTVAQKNYKDLNTKMWIFN